MPSFGKCSRQRWRTSEIGGGEGADNWRSTSFFAPLPSLDLRALWRAFKAARLRKESATAHERLCAYLRQALVEAPAAPPPLPTERNRFDLVPSCIA